MPTQLMRLIDYWIGVPLCFLCEIAHFFTRLFVFRKKQPIPRSVLFIKLSEMGSIILSYTLLKRIKEEYPASKILFLTFKKNKPLLELLNIIEPGDILTIAEDSPLVFITDTFKVILRMKKENIDIVFDLELFSRFTAILTYLSGAGKRIGFYRYYFEGLYRGNLLTHNIQYNPMIHTSKTLLSLFQVVKLDRKTTPELKMKIEDNEIIIPKYISSKESIDQIWERLGKLGVARQARLFLLNPGDGIIPMREWPLQNYINLTRWLLEDNRNYIIIIGTGGVSRKAAQLALEVNNRRCLDLTNQTLLSEVMALYNTAEALIANDCGLAHIASLTPIKKFVIFGPESPQVYKPLGENTWIIYANLSCSPCLSTFNHRNSACRDNQCLKLIEADEVYELIKKI